MWATAILFFFSPRSAVVVCTKAKEKILFGMRIKAKKAKGDEAFTTKKQKVGRKKLAPATATRAEVHARTLFINNAISNDGEGDDDADGGVIPLRSFHENITAAGHYRENVRRGAMNAILAHLVAEGASISPVQRLQALNTALDTLTDTDGETRNRAVKAFEEIIKHSAPDTDTMHFVLRHTHIALTHALGGVKKAGVEVVASLLRFWKGAIRDAAASFDTVQIVVRVAEVVCVGKAPQLAVLASLLEEVCGTSYDRAVSDSRQSATILSVPAATKLFESWSGSLGLMWKESMEMQGELFRQATALDRAVAIARCFAAMATFLQSRGCLVKHHARFLKEMLVVKVSFDLVSGEGTATTSDARLRLARYVAAACIPILHNSDEAFRWFHMCVTICLSNGSSAIALELLQRAVALHPLLVVRMSSLLAPLLNTMIRNGSQSVDIAAACGELLQRFFAVDTYPNETLAALAGALNLVPRVLFSIRRLEREARSRITERFLRTVWLVCTQRHPVLRVLDLASFAETMQSIFGMVTGDGTVVPGVLEGASDDVAKLGVHLFYYLGVSPRTTTFALPLMPKIEAA